MSKKDQGLLLGVSQVFLRLLVDADRHEFHLQAVEDVLGLISHLDKVNTDLALVLHDVGDERSQNQDGPKGQAA